MLTTEEINKLFDLLKDLHGKDKPRDKRTLAIWAAVLEPWSYSEVRSAAVARARENRYYPDPGELTGFLSAPETPSGATKPQPSRGADAKAKEAQDRLFARMRNERDRLIPLRQAVGIPATMEEARATGMTATEWWDGCERAGLNYPDNVFCEEGAL